MRDYDYDFRKAFVGKVIDRIRQRDKEHIDFWFVDGSTRRLYTDGDCCSVSWIEHLTMPDDIVGATIQSVDEPTMPPHDDHKCIVRDWSKPYDENDESTCGHDSLAVYHTRFRTDRGDIVLEYRNDSNGYYGGNLNDDGEIPEAERG